MRITATFCTAAAVCSVLAASLDAQTPASTARVAPDFGRLPITFERNDGQAPADAQFVARGPGYTVFLTRGEAVLALGGASTRDHRPSEVVRLQLTGASPDAGLSAEQELPTRSNFLVGNDPARWRRNVPNYGRVRYRNIYDGIDLVYYGNQRQLEHDFIVSPGGDPAAIVLGVSGAAGLSLAPGGDLLVKTAHGELRLLSPVVYQDIDGRRVRVSGRYRLRGKDRIGFAVGHYDRRHPLIIDPVLSYATYLGGTNTETGYGIAVDSNGNAYVTGTTASTDFPITVGSPVPSGGYYVFVAKLDPTGTQLIYSTVFGGNWQNIATGIAVDASGNAYVSGETNSCCNGTDPLFPTTANAYQRDYKGNTDLFVTKLDPTGSNFVYSTLLGGTNQDLGPDSGNGIAIDSQGNAYVTGGTNSLDFPVQSQAGDYVQATHTPNGGLTNNSDAFVSKLSADGSTLLYSTYLGGTEYDRAYGIAVDSSSNIYVTGYTLSYNDPTLFVPEVGFPVLNAFQSDLNGGGNACSSGYADAFVTKFSATNGGYTLGYSTYFGGSDYDQPFGIAVDSGGNAYITGYTGSGDYPAVNALQTYKGGFDAFLTKFDSSGWPSYSTWIGGTAGDTGYAVAVDSLGDAYVTGTTRSTDFPTTAGAFPVNDAFLVKMNAAGTAYTYSTYIGGNSTDNPYGIATDTAGNVYIAGQTFSTNLATAGAYQTAKAGSYDAFVMKISDSSVSATTTTLVSAPNPSTFGQSVTFTATVTSGGGIPSGAVTFSDSGTIVATVALDASGVATFSTSSLSVGTHSITASYGGLNGFTKSSSPAVAQLVAPAPTATTLTTSSGSVEYLQTVQFTATVTSTAGTPAGSVEFLADGNPIGSGTLNASGVATFSTGALSIGAHTMTAQYPATGNYDTSTSPGLTQTVVKDSTSTLVDAAPNPSVFTQSVVFSIRVMSWTGTPTGSVTLSEGGAPLGAATPLDGTGLASFSTSVLSVGTHNITAAYSGDSTYAASSQLYVQTVNRIPTTTALTTSLTPAYVGQNVTFTATITPQIAGAATGNVAFWTELGPIQTVPVSANTAVLTVNTLPVGLHTVTAYYTDVTGGNYASSNSAGIAETIVAIPTTVTLTATPNPSISGQTVTMQAAVAAQGGGTVSGTITFKDGSLTLGNVIVLGNQSSYSTEWLGVGTHTLTATYSGDGQFAAGTSAPLSQAVQYAITSPPRSAFPAPVMKYYGGPVVSNVQVQVVFWGNNVDPTVRSGIGDFYSKITDSSYLDLLGEYSTAGLTANAGASLGQPGSNQLIARGSYSGATTITPSICNTSPCQVYDSQIQSEIDSQITAGVLPQPTYDTAGRANTAYMIYFPPGVTITTGTPAAPGVDSCSAFCSYHGTGSWNQKDLFYAAVPDFGPASACSNVCGGGPTVLDDITLGSSHELAEIVTDGAVGRTTSYGAPLAWYSQQQSNGSDYGETADVCNSIAGNVRGYTVQLVWSNQQNACAVGAAARFAVTAPSDATIGTPFNVTVTAQDAGGSTLGGYTGTVRFASTDPQAVLPADYTFTAADAGVATLAVTLQSAGSQQVSVSDVNDPGYRGSAVVNVGSATSVTVTVSTTPGGPSFTVDGVAYAAPQSFSWTVGSTHTIATASQTAAGVQYTWKSWSDGGAITHQVTASSSTTAYVASFDTAYQLTTGVAPQGGGSVQPASGQYFAANSTVGVTATAAAGYAFSGWTGPVADPANPVTSIVMAGPAAITANFAPVVNVTVGTSPAGLAFTVDNVTHSSPQTFAWPAGSSHSLGTTSPQLAPTPGTRYVWSGWSDGGALSHSVTASTATTSYLATFGTEYQLSTAANPVAGGTVTPASGQYYATGAVVNVSAAANAGYLFANWTGNVANAAAASTTVTMTAPQSVTANFNQTVSVTVGTSPSGLGFSVDNVAYTAPQSFVWVVGTQHSVATTTPQPGASGVQYVWSGWSDGGAIAHAVVAAVATTTYTAGFKTQYQLLTAANPIAGGTVTPASGQYFDAGTIVAITAAANAGYAFSSWTGAVASAASASTTVTMSAPQAVTANFSVAPTTLSAAVAAKAGPANARVWTIAVTNAGPGLANATQIDGVTLTKATGRPCSPVVTTPFPVSIGNLAAGASGSGLVTIDFSSCAANTTVNASIAVSANAGATSATIAVKKQTP